MFYDTFVALCEIKGVTPTRAAIEIGMSKGTPTTWKKLGTTPRAAQLQNIADYFGVSVSDLLSNEIEKAATLSDDGYSEKKKSLLKAVEQMSEEQAELLLSLWEQFRAEK